MSSEATTYFPDTLVNTSTVRQLGHCETDFFPDPHDKAAIQSDLAESHAGANTRVAEILDELLMEQVQQGTKEARSHMFRRHARAVPNVACRILRNEAEADDLVQEAFLFIFRGATLFNASRGTSRSWIVEVTDPCAFDRCHINTRHTGLLQDARRFFIELCVNLRTLAYKLLVNLALDQRNSSNRSDYNVAYIVERMILNALVTKSALLPGTVR